jgi:hypothetical protein
VCVIIAGVFKIFSKKNRSNRVMVKVFYPDEIRGLKKIIFFAFLRNQILSSNDRAAVGTKG